MTPPLAKPNGHERHSHLSKMLGNIFVVSFFIRIVFFFLRLNYYHDPFKQYQFGLQICSLSQYGFHSLKNNLIWFLPLILTKRY